MTRTWVQGRGALVGLAIAPLLLASCGGKQPEAAAAPAAEQSDPMEIRVTEALASKIRTARVATAEVSSALTVAARVEVDTTRETRIGSPVMGRVAALYAEEGQEVHKGDLLATLQSTGLNEAQLEFLKALSQKMVAERAVERARLLLKADVIGAADLQRREAELAQAAAELEAARDELSLLGFSAEDILELERRRTIRSIARITASMEGTIIRRSVTLGQVVQPADTAFEIADLSHLWIVADVPEQEAGRVRTGQAVTAEIAAFAGKPIEGKLSFVSALVNPETRTVFVRMNVANPDRRIKPSMLATLTIHGHPQQELVAPEKALVREGEQEYVFVERAPGRFLLTPVRTGQAWRGQKVIVDGLRENDTIVSEGAFHLNNERRRRSLRGSE